MKALYTILYLLSLLFILPSEFLKRRQKIRLRWLKEKLGLFQVKEGFPNSIWIHAVSVGESLAAKGLVEYLKRNYPDRLLFFSTMTDTGQQIAKRQFQDERVFVVYMPFDIGFIIRKVFKRLKVSLFITMETELWPATFYELNRLAIPIIVANARLSERSLKGYKRIRFFMRPVLRSVTAFLCSSELDLQRLKALGVEDSRLYVTGNLKFDMPPLKPPSLTLKGNSGKGVIVIGSTHPGEEAMLLKGLEGLIRDKKVFILLAPRHPERFEEVARFLKKEGLKFIKRTDVPASELDEGLYDGMLLDTIGELASFYYLADLTIVGGSFVPVGGHNLLEPAYWSKPIICGKYMHNFPLAEEFFKEGGAIVADSQEINRIVSHLLQAPQKQRDMGLKARSIYERNAGALRKSISIIEHYIPSRPSE